MKNFKNFISILLCLLLVIPFSYAQETQGQFNERKKEMLRVEAKIATYIAKHINDEIPKEEMIRLEESLNNHEHDDEGHNHELSADDKQQLRVEFIKNYWRIQYFKVYPNARASYSPKLLASSCNNGDFEGGNFAGYSAQTSNQYRRGDCNLFTGAPTTIASAITFSPTTMAAPRYIITNVGNDPSVTTATLPMVWNGNHSVRINDLAGGYRSEKLIKQVVLSQANERIYFNYALVMHNPNGHNNQKPTFIARVLDNSGNESDRLCTSAYASDPFLFPANSSGSIVYKSWVCDNVQANGAIGDTVTLEFIMVDCGQSAHGGYAYIDDICDTCSGVPDSCNFQGSIQLNPTDTCTGDTMQVCGTYILAAQNCTTAVADEIRLYIYQNGSQVGTTPIALNTSPSGGAFCFSVDPSDFPVTSGGYDFYVEVDFDLGTLGTTIQNDYHTNPGQNNDYIFNAQCCPDFEILTCCDLAYPTGLKSKLGLPSVYSKSAAVKSAITSYKSRVNAKYYPTKSTTSSGAVDPCCDFCEYPDVAFPIFIYGDDGNLISDVAYNISWSNDPSNTSAIGSAFTDSMVIVTVSGPDSCVWADTFLIECCQEPGNTGFCCDTIDFEVDIDSLCGFNPCKFPTTPFPIRVLRNGTVLSTSGYSFQWSTGANSSAISVTQTQLPVWVLVTDLTTGCIDTGYYDIKCDSCTPTVPTNLKCSIIKGVKTLTWDVIPGATYELELYYGDPKCCKNQMGWISKVIVNTNSYSVSSLNCFSWRVRSVCKDGAKSAFSNKECSCVPMISCRPRIPSNLRCTVVKGGQSLSWNPVAGATYEVEIIWNDPKCCKGGSLPYSQLIQVKNPNYQLSSLSGCFSWRVRSVCQNGTKSAWSVKECSCKLIISLCNAKTPSNLKCSVVKGGQSLSWDAVPGATYEISFYYGNPRCCKKQIGSITKPVSVTKNSFFVSSSSCFSWSVRSVCPDGTKSAWSNSCSCSLILLPSKIGVSPKGNNIKIGVNSQEMKVLTSPNPAVDFITFEVVTKNTLEEYGTLEVTNLAGNLVHSSQIRLNGKSMIDFTNLNTGTYIYRVISENSFKSGKIVITD